MDNLKEHNLEKYSEPYFDKKNYYVPKKCPHCSIAISVDIFSTHKFHYNQSHDVNFLLHRCPECSKNFVTTHLRDKLKLSNQFISCYPSLAKHQHNKIIEEFSPRFVDVFNQAYIAEQMNHLTLAGTGYRISLEILAKDFAISEHPAKKDEILETSLNNCIQNYFKDLESSVAAHVVRNLGNDYTHYFQKFEIDFTEIKYYLNSATRELASLSNLFNLSNFLRESSKPWVLIFNLRPPKLTSVIHITTFLIDW